MPEKIIILNTQITEADFVPFDQFRLSWRFTNPKYNQLPQADLSEIRPLNEKTAKSLAQHARDFVDNSGLVKDELSSVISCRTFIDTVDPRSITQWLFDRVPPIDQPILILWLLLKDAIITKWRLFPKYWNDFCYPSSDDVLILPVTAYWILFYSHEEIFEFGIRRP